MREVFGRMENFVAPVMCDHHDGDARIQLCSIHPRLPDHHLGIVGVKARLCKKPFNRTSKARQQRCRQCIFHQQSSDQL